MYRVFAEAGLADDVVFVGAGKLGLANTAAVGFALGCDMIGVAREAMFAIGCVQAQKCHDDHCPTGIATQNPWLVRGLDPTLKAERFANYIRALRRELLKMSEACGVLHPALIRADQVELLLGNRVGTPLSEVFDYQPGWGLPSPTQVAELEVLMADAPQGGHAPVSATSRGGGN